MRRLALLFVLTTCLLLLPAPLHSQAPLGTPGPFDGQSPLEPPTLIAAPVATVTATASPTPLPTATPEPTATATATLAPYQVSPLLAQDSGRLPDDGSPLWVGAAALLVLAGSGVLLLAQRRVRG